MLLEYHKEFKTMLPNHFLIDLWCSNYSSMDDDVIRTFLKVTSADGYNEMIKVLFADTVSIYFCSAVKKWEIVDIFCWFS